MAAKQLFVSIGDYSNFKVDFVGSTYEELVEAIKQQAPSECFSTNQEVASLHIFSEQLAKYMELTPEKVSTVEDSSKISVIMKVSCGAEGCTAPTPNFKLMPGVKLYKCHFWY